MFRKKPAPPDRRRLNTTDRTQQTRTAFSYHAQRHAHEDGSRSRVRPGTPKLNGPTLRKIATHLGANALLFSVAAGFITVVTTNTFVSSKPPAITFHGTPEQRLLLQDKQVYALEAQTIFQNSFLNRSKLTFNTQSFEQELIKKYPEVAHATVDMPLFGQHPTIHITPSPGVLEFITASGEGYIVDDTGKVVSSATTSHATSFIRVLDQSGFQAEHGSQILSSRDVSFIIRLQNQMVRHDIKVASYTLRDASRQIDMRITGKPYYVKFSFENDVLQQAGAYVGVQEKLDATKQAPAEYIDVRVGDRVYYK